jgi:hypothetical protein
VFKPGTRHARQAEIILKPAKGEERRVELDVLYNFYMSDIGYFHQKWGHGMWVGEDVSTYEWQGRRGDSGDDHPWCASPERAQRVYGLACLIQPADQPASA